jgi:hypothetical protein
MLAFQTEAGKLFIKNGFKNNTKICNTINEQLAKLCRQEEHFSNPPGTLPNLQEQLSRQVVGIYKNRSASYMTNSTDLMFLLQQEHPQLQEQLRYITNSDSFTDSSARYRTGSAEV